MLRNFRTYQLAVKHYQLCTALRLPRHLQDQLLRAASSVALNLAEGAARESQKERKRFFNIAFASLKECQAVLDLAPTNATEVLELLDTTGAHLYKLIKSI